MSRGTRDLKTMVALNRQAESEQLITPRNQLNNSSNANDLKLKLAKLKHLSEADKELILQLQAKLADQETELNLRSKIIQDIQDNAQKMAEHFTSRNSREVSLAKENMALQDKIDNQSQDIMHKNRRISGATIGYSVCLHFNRLVELEALNAAAEARLSRESALASATKDAHAQSLARCQSFEKDNGSLRTAAENLKDHNEKLRTERDNIQREYNQKLLEVDQLTQELKKAQALQATQNAAASQGSLPALALDVLGDRTLAALNEKIRRLEGEVEKAAQENAFLQLRISSSDSDRAQLGDRETVLVKQLESAKGSIKNLEDALALANRNSSNAAKDATGLQQRLGSVAAALQEAQRLHKDAQAALEAATAREGLLQSELNGLRESLSDGANAEGVAMRAVQGELAAEKEARQALEERMKTLSRTVNAETSSLQAKLEASQARFAEASARLREATEGSVDARQALSKSQTLAAEQANELRDLRQQLIDAAARAHREAARADASDKELSAARLALERAEGTNKDFQDRIAAFFVLEKELLAAVSKLVAAQAGMEGLFTCMSCMEMFKDPVTFSPCGHTSCRACADGSAAGSSHCPECDEEVEFKVGNAQLDQLTGKFAYARQTLTTLIGITEQLKKKSQEANGVPAFPGGASASNASTFASASSRAASLAVQQAQRVMRGEDISWRDAPSTPDLTLVEGGRPPSASTSLTSIARPGAIPDTSPDPPRAATVVTPGTVLSTVTPKMSLAAEASLMVGTELAERGGEGEEAKEPGRPGSGSDLKAGLQKFGKKKSFSTTGKNAAGSGAGPSKTKSKASGSGLPRR